MPDEEDDEDVQLEQAERDVTAFRCFGRTALRTAETELADAVLQVVGVAWADINVLMAEFPSTSSPRRSSDLNLAECGARLLAKIPG
jgi:hypothetical protein